MGVSGAYYISSINSWCGYYGERWFKHIRYYQLSNECGEPWKWRPVSYTHLREFNISYLKAPDIISLLRDEVSQYTSAPFNVRIESETAVFYKIPRVTFWEYVNEDKKLQDYINAYYREQLSQAIYRQQLMTMNGKTGAVCAFLYLQIEPFGKKMKDGILIDFQITNDDIAGFCGISTRNSVNRILRGLRENGIIFIADQKILIKDKEYLEQYVKG